MARSMLPRRPVLPIALAAAALGWSAGAWAQTIGPQAIGPQPAPPPAAAPDTIRLTDAQRDAILDASTEESAAAARGERSGSADADDGARRIHGEMGVMIGSNGTRGAFGTAAVPLGDNAGAVISFESSRFGYRRPRASPR